MPRDTERNAGGKDLHFACTLYDEKKYNEAEKRFRQVVQAEERTLGKDHEDTLQSKHWLGHALHKQQKYGEAEEQFRQVVQGREKTLGRDHEDTLDSMYWLGCILYDQNKYSEAKVMLQQAIQVQERTLGRDHENTFDSKYWLGRILYDQNKYSEAEKVFQQAIQGQERTLGKDHEDTLSSKHWLGRILCDQNKYSEAEEMLQQSLQGQERTLGKDHEDTIYGKYWLGRILYNQNKYSEAEGMLQQVIQGQERTLGRDHGDTLDSKYWLGRILYDQNKYSEAKEMLQQVIQGQERTLGRDHEDTLDSKYWLGRILYDQNKYSETKEMLQQVIQGQERTLGRDHGDTLDSKYWLGLTLYMQGNYREAEEPLQQAVDGQERTLGRNHKDTLATVRLLQKLQLKSSSLSSTNVTAQHTPAGRLNGYFSEDQDNRKSYTNSEICEISALLKHSNPRWSQVPRTYIVLRTISFLNFLDNLIDVGFSDYWFPVTERNLPDCLRPSVRAAFVGAQSLVLTKSMDLERGEDGQHCHFKQGEFPPLESKGILGNGGFGQVDKVLNQISFKEYARKRVLRSSAFRGRRKEYIKQFIAEIEILKRLKHHHIVELIGSYTDPRYMGLIMSPVAEMDLGAYLTRATISNHPELRTFFGCLATALEYLHEHKVRHKDIKPGNILVHRGNVLFVDFGLSFDFTNANGSTTMSMVNGLSPRYCAPEVAQYAPRNTMSDVWSLGVVFMEMIVVLKGKTVRDMDEFLRERGSRQTFIHTNLDALPEIFAELEGIGNLSDNRALGWTRQMLSPEQQLRPTASLLAASIAATSQEGESMSFCGICCVSSEEDFSDWVDE